MLKSSRIIALNLSSQTLGLAEFCKQPHGGIILLNYRLREFPMNLGSDEIHHGQSLTTLSEMMAELGIGSGAVNYAVPAQSVFTRFVKLPPVDDEKIERIIAFEARQNIPFPIDQVIWDYQIFRQTDDDGIRVMLVAIKTGLLEEINTAVERTRLRTRIVEVPAMALYNAFRYNYRDVTGSSLLVDLGARATNLLFVEPHKLFART